METCINNASLSFDRGSVYGATSSVNEGTQAFNDSYYGDDLTGRIQITLPGTATSELFILCKSHLIVLALSLCCSCPDDSR